MELNQLEYFLETAKREHITQAAEALNITQPALSKTIARLEDDLGVKLCDREGKGIRLNEYGQLVLRYAEKILYTIGDMRAELSEMTRGRLGSLRVGSSFPAGEPNWLLEQIRSFIMDRPDIGFHLQQYSTPQLLASLESRSIDLAISSTPMQDEGIHWTELFVEPMGVILSAHHPLAAREELSLVDLRQERFYCNNANSDLQELTYHFCALAGFKPNVHFECEFPSFIGISVSQGYGISIISRRGYENSQKGVREKWEENIIFRPLKEEYCRRVCGVAFLETRHLTCVAQEFYQHLLSAFVPQ